MEVLWSVDVVGERVGIGVRDEEEDDDGIALGECVGDKLTTVIAVAVVVG